MHGVISNKIQGILRLRWTLAVFGLVLICGAAENRVLDLDGKNSFVELPSHIFNELEEATVEGWIKFKEFRTESRFFDFGTMGPGMYVTEIHATPSIRFTIDLGNGGPQHTIEVANALRLDHWRHIAAVTGHSGMVLYLDGVLVGTNEYPGSFQSIRNGDHNYLGRNNWRGSFRAEDFHGQMDEIRVWRTARTQKQIQESLFQRLTGSEDGLIGLWNFDGGDAQDSSAGGHHGRLAGNARCVSEALPSPEEFLRPMLLHGKVTDDAGNALPGATLVLEHEHSRIAEVVADRDGEYQMAIYSTRETFDLSATSGTKGDWRLNQRLQPGESRRVDFAIEEASLLSGRVGTLDARIPQGRIAVQAVRAGSTNSTVLGLKNSTVVADTQWTDDVSGRFAFVNLKPGRYQLRCHGDGRFIYFEQGNLVEVGPGKALPEIRFSFPPIKKGHWKSYTLIDGLPIDDIHDIHFDREGFMWLAARGGVVRFDGAHWTRFTKEDGLADNRVNAITQDRDGGLWFATENGVARYARRRWSVFRTVDGLADNRVRALLATPDGSMWLATAGGVSHFDGEGWETIDQSKGLPDDDVSSICPDTTGALWFGTREGACQYDGRSFRNFTANNGLADNVVSAIQRGADGVIWIGTAGGLTRIDGRTFSSFKSKDGLPSGRVRSIHTDAQGALWIATDSQAGTVEGGLTRWDGRTFVRYGKVDGLSSDSVRSIRQTSDGTIWCATEAGVSRFHETGIASFTMEDGLPNNDVSRMRAFPDGSIWTWRVGQGEDEYHWPESDPGDGTCRYDGSSFTVFDFANGLAGNRISAIFRDPSGAVWLAGQGGVSRYQNQSWRRMSATSEWGGDGGISIDADPDGTLWFGRHNGVSRYDGGNLADFAAKNVLANNHVSAVHRDANGLLWFATLHQGLWRFDGERFQNFSTNQGLPSPKIHSIQSAPDGKLWFRTGRGIACFDGGQFTAFSAANGLAEDEVNVLDIDSKGTIWVGTAGSGVTRYRDGAFTTFTAARNRLAHDRINAIYQDAEGVIWFGTDGGVSQFNGIGWSSIDERDGLAGNRVRAIAQDAKGVFWFATNKGLTRYERGRVRPKPPVVTLKTGEDPSLNSIPTVTLGRRVTLDFHVVDFNNRSQNRKFRCQIQRGAASEADELGEDWLPPNAEPQLEWRASKPGFYTFAVQYIDRDLSLSEPAWVTLKVVPQWYLNAWIAIPSGAGILALLSSSLFAGRRYVVHRREAERLREQMLRQERQAREALEQSNRSLGHAKDAAEAANRAKSEFLANMSHEIRTPLNAVLGYAQILKRDATLGKEQKQALGTIEQSGSHLLALINEILDLSKIESGRMDLSVADFDLNELLAGLSVMFDSRCRQKGLGWEMECLTGAPVWVRGDEGKLRQVLINLLSNAVKYTELGRVRFHVQRTEGDTYRFAVEDTGPGILWEAREKVFEPFTQDKAGREKGGTGLGLAIARRQTELMGGKLRLESVIGKGSRFSFSLQLEEGSAGRARPKAHERRVRRLKEGTKVKALVLDDITENRDILERFLRELGAQVVTVSSGEAALSRLGEERFDIAFLDIRMPGMTGLELAERVVGEFGTGRAKLVAITASALKHEQQAYEEKGFDAFVPKPFRFEQICECMAQHLGVAFEYESQTDEERKQQMPPEEAKVELPGDLLDRLKQAAEVYSVTEFEEHLSEMEVLGETERRVAEQLRELSRDVQIDEILRILAGVRSRAG